MTAHYAPAPSRSVRSIRKALTENALPGETNGFTPTTEREAAEFLASVGCPAAARRSRAGDRIDRRRGRPAADADRHRQRRHALPGRFGRQRDRRAQPDHPPAAPSGASASTATTTACLTRARAALRATRSRRESMMYIELDRADARGRQRAGRGAARGARRRPRRGARLARRCRRKMREDAGGDRGSRRRGAAPLVRRRRDDPARL